MAAVDSAPTAAHGRAPTRPRLALRVRRWLLVLMPVLAGLCVVAGAVADPGPGLQGEPLYEVYGDEPGPLQWKSIAYHWGYAFWMAPALLILPLVRGRGAGLANVAGVVGFVGITTLPGMLIVDYYDSAIVQEFGVAGGVAVEAQMDQMWGLPVFALPGMLGLFFALPLAGLTLWRAGLVRWWAPATAIAGFLALSSATSGDWWGYALVIMFLAVFSIALAQATRHTAAPHE